MYPSQKRITVLCGVFFSKKPAWLAVTCNATNKPRLIQPAAHSSAVCWLEGRRRIHCLFSSLGYTQDQITSDLWWGCMISIWYLKFLFRLNTLQFWRTAVKSYVTKRLKDLSWHIMLLENTKTKKTKKPKKSVTAVTLQLSLITMHVLK